MRKFINIQKDTLLASEISAIGLDAKGNTVQITLKNCDTPLEYAFDNQTAARSQLNRIKSEWAAHFGQLNTQN